MGQLFQIRVMALLVIVSGSSCLADEGPANSTYQRSRQTWGDAPHASQLPHMPPHSYDKPNHGQHQHGQPYASQPQVSGGYFTKPYPYHLDYYKMRWGGSYEPYMGNIYGPPNVVLGVPPYYGGYAPQYGAPYGNQYGTPYGQAPYYDAVPQTAPTMVP